MESKKYDEGKLDWSLVPVECIEELIKVQMYGVKKYGRNTWQNLPDAEDRYYSALMRHLAAWRKGEEFDESGMFHLSHALCNAVYLLWQQLKGNEND
jgi:hypothetical protein